MGTGQLAVMASVCQLIHYTQVKKMWVMYKSAHVAIALQLLEMISFTTPN